MRCALAMTSRRDRRRRNAENTGGIEQDGRAFESRRLTEDVGPLKFSRLRPHGKSAARVIAATRLGELQRRHNRGTAEETDIRHQLQSRANARPPRVSAGLLLHMQAWLALRVACAG